MLHPDGQCRRTTVISDEAAGGPEHVPVSLDRACNALAESSDGLRITPDLLEGRHAEPQPGAAATDCVHHEIAVIRILLEFVEPGL